VTSRDRIVVMVVVAAAVLAAFWFLALGPKRKDASELGAQVDQQRQQVASAREELQANEAARASFASNYTAVARLGKAVPGDDDVPSLVYQLDTTAEGTAVDFRSLKLSAAGGGSTPPAPPSNSSGGSGSGGSSAPNSGGGSSQGQGGGGSSGSTGSASTSTAPPSEAATAALPPGAVVGQAGLATMPFSFNFQGSFFNLAKFFGRLESYVRSRRGGLDVAGRLLTIDGVSLTAGPGGFPSMKASVSATAYVLPADQSVTNGASPVGPTPVQPASSSSPAPAPAPAAATGVAG
jgi:Tfp pilus assembly protein PilO